MDSIIVDANVFLRFFVPENKILYEKASALFKRGGSSKLRLIVPQIIIFEVNFSLLKYYSFEKERIINALKSIISSSKFEVESKDIFIEAFKIYESQNLDLTDCFLVAKKNQSKNDIFTFDKKLNKYAKSS